MGLGSRGITKSGIRNESLPVEIFLLEPTKSFIIVFKTVPWNSPFQSYSPGIVTVKKKKKKTASYSLPKILFRILLSLQDKWLPTILNNSNRNVDNYLPSQIPNIYHNPLHLTLCFLSQFFTPKAWKNINS